MDTEAIWNRFYSRTYLLNEMLFGQRQEQIELMQRQTGIRLNIDYENCWLLLTGVQKSEYNHRLGLDRARYMTLHENLVSEIEAMSREEQVEAEVVVLNWDRSKRFAIILSPRRARFDPMPCAGRISRMIEAQYRQLSGEDVAYFSNIMVVSEPIGSYAQLQSQFAELLEMYHLSFFRRTHQPMTAQIMREGRVPYSMVEVEQCLDELEEALYSRDGALAGKLLSRMWISGIKRAQDCALCREALAALRRRMRTVGLVLGTAMEEMDDFPDMERFLCIEELHQALVDFTETHLLAPRKTAGCPGRISLQAATYMRKHYFKPIGLADIAEHIRVNTAYLSRIFKQEMGVGVTQYLARLRMEQSMRLLRETDMRIGEVALHVGIEDAHYFSSLFRRYTGCSPAEYRKNQMRAEPSK